MGSSYRSDLNNGSMKSWEIKLNTSAHLLEEVISEVLEFAHESDQADNAAHDGGLAEKLSIAKRFILEELPKAKCHTLDCACKDWIWKRIDQFLAEAEKSDALQ